MEFTPEKIAEEKKFIIKILQKIARLVVECSFVEQKKYYIRIHYTTVTISFEISEGDKQLVNFDFYTLDTVLKDLNYSYCREKLELLKKKLVEIEAKVLKYHRLIHKDSK